MEEMVEQVHAFVGAVTCLSSGEQVKVLADVVAALLAHDGHLEQALLYVQSQIPDKEMAQEKEARKQEALLAFKKANIKVSPLFAVDKEQPLRLGSSREKEEQDKRDRDAIDTTATPVAPTAPQEGGPHV